jgi:hemolysin activation/secretion protein
MQIGKAKAGVAYTAMDYRLGKEFNNIDANGNAQIASLFGNYPLIRSRNNNLNTQLSFDAKTFRDKIDSTATIHNKQAWVGMAGLAGDHRDNFFGGGLSNYSLTWTSGNIDIQSPDTLAANLATAHSNGHYDKFSLTAMRLQNITQAVSLYAAIKGQVATKNLDVSEKMELGGTNNIRAYPEGEAYADQGYVLNVEARWLLPPMPAPVPGQVQLIGFIDNGTVELNKNPWSPGQNSRILTGGGVGFNWADNSNFAVKGFYAHKLGNNAAISAPDQAGRFWIQAVKYF